MSYSQFLEKATAAMTETNVDSEHYYFQMNDHRGNTLVDRFCSLSMPRDSRVPLINLVSSRLCWTSVSYCRDWVREDLTLFKHQKSFFINDLRDHKVRSHSFAIVAFDSFDEEMIINIISLSSTNKTRDSEHRLPLWNSWRDC